MFEQTIFPSVEKKKSFLLTTPTCDLLVLGIDFWFVHTSSEVLQTVKCPCCGKKYNYCKFQPLVDIDYICKTIKEKEDHYFKEFMRECPDTLKHSEMDLWTRLSK